MLPFWTRIQDVTGTIVAQIIPIHPKGERQQGDFQTELANAALICQAPELLAQRDELLAACDRMIVGITKQDTVTCEWYEGIEYDTIDEARAAIERCKP